MNTTPLSITELSSVIKQTIEGNVLLSNVAVIGEVSNITRHSSGHIYFTMKDAGAVISAAFFKYANRGCKVRLNEGMKVIAIGSVTVYEKRGSYQLIVKSLVEDGIGELQRQIQQLKERLLKEGLFDQERKRPLPFLPQRVGIVTSPTGAAFRDILKVLLRRFPTIEIILAPAKVQGSDASVSIVRAIEELNKEPYKIDLIIAGRGGGSFEDLMPFNEEPAVRAFAESRVPIISAVGHQVDHPLTDDVADVAAPTPSAAAEIAVPIKSELEDDLRYYNRALAGNLEKLVERYRMRINSVTDRRIFQNPLDMISLRQVNVEELTGRMSYSLRSLLHLKIGQLRQIGDLNELVQISVMKRRHSFLLALQAIDQLSPIKVMSRGYAVVRDNAQSFVKSISAVTSGETLRIFFNDGSAGCEVKTVQKGDTLGKEKKQ
ncbi:MAG: exodeoxyribonuclease VII large subunit [Spirochaetes bacterium]|jgi:exodeoxyribonuclease VII large subunit|nr:exodeoxyribonuclease VII large subunit [Spirochaetota bacterium]